MLKEGKKLYIDCFEWMRFVEVNVFGDHRRVPSAANSGRKRRLQTGEKESDFERKGYLWT